jgi:endonuclease/exonuclease/phosphatase family metal-dependent hydrolase
MGTEEWSVHFLRRSEAYYVRHAIGPIGGAILLVACLADVSAEEPQGAPQPALTIATYNINWGNPDLKTVVAAIREAHADVVALQETNAESEAFLRKELKDEYPHKEFHAAAAAAPAGGFAFLSRKPLKGVTFVEPRFGFFGAFVAEVEFQQLSIQIVSVHLQPAIPKGDEGLRGIWRLFQDMEDIHVQEIERLYESVAKDKAAIVLGDFNSLPTLNAPAFLKEKGLTDSFAAVNKDSDRQATWHWRQNGVDYRFRLDYIFHSAQISTTESRIVKREASDHYLLVSRVRWADGK